MSEQTPGALSGWPPPTPQEDRLPTPKRKKGRGRLVGIVTVAVALGVASGYGAVRSANDQDQQAGPVSGSSPAAEPSQLKPKPTATKPSPPPSTDEKQWKYKGYGLNDNKIYNVDLPAGKGRCTITVYRPRPPLKDSKLLDYLGTLSECYAKVLKDPLAEQRIPIAAPDVIGFRKKIKSPCGTLSPANVVALHCSGNSTVYWVFSSDEGSYAFTFARLGYVTVFAHEMGHHLQNKSGITGKYYEAYRKADAKERLKLTRRSELQADCFAGVILRYLSTSIKLTDHDQVEIRQWFYDNGDEDVAAGLAPDHGSSTAQIYWLERGLKDANFEDCNTWTAKSSRVK